MRDFLKQNPGGVMLIMAAVLIGIVAVGVQGCDLKQMIKVNVPQGVQAAVNVPPKVSLAEAQNVYEDFRAWSGRQTASFSESIESGWRWFGFFQGAMRIGLAEAQAAGMGAFPLGGLLVSLLMGAGGLAITKPGTAAKIAEEKRASFNKGHEEGVAAANGGAS